MSPRLLLVALVLAGCRSETDGGFAVSVRTTVVPGGSLGDVYFRCSGLVTSTELWISSDSTAGRESADYAAAASRSEALARIVGDTLEVFSPMGFVVPPEPALPYAFRQHVDGAAYRELRERAGREGLVEVQC